MLSFLSPLFLAGAAAAAIPIVLHLLKREPEPRVKFAAVTLLKRAPVELAEKRRLREWLLLALRVATLVLLAVAFARPFFATGAAVGRPGVTVVALDTSYSMAAPGRFDRAKQLAKDAISRAPSGNQVGVITFADEVEMAARPGVDRVLAAAAIDRAAQTFGATRYRSALQAAAQSLAGRRGAIVVVTDLQENGWDAGDRVSIPEGVTVAVADVGALPPNLAVIAVRPLADRVVATIRNTGSQAREARVHLTIDDRPAGDATISLGTDRAADVTFAGAPGGAAAVVTVDDREGIQPDNIRYAVLGGTARPAVLVVTGGAGLEAFYVQHALGAGTAEDGAYRTANVAGGQLSSWTADQLAAHAAVVLLSTRGLERRGREALASYAMHGGGLFIAAGPEIDGDVIADVLGTGSTLHVATEDATRPAPRTLAPADARHPVFQPFTGAAATLGLVSFRQAARISGAGCQTLARFTTGESAVLECPAGDGRALVLASDLDNRWNDFPLHAAFVPFLHEVIGYLASARGHASDYLVGDVPAGVRKSPGVVVLNEPGRAGTSPRRIAINVDPREGNPARLSARDFQSAVTQLKGEGRSGAPGEARQEEDRQHLWQYALALMAALLAVEGIVASRTI
jgi:Aerotolerance regulator N-terminal/von Willebrand factor type A domain